VSGTSLSALARLAERRFASFSEAADAVLDVLEAELPAGSVLLGHVDRDEGEYRLIDVRGEAAARVRPGDTIALARGDDRGGLLDPAALAELAVRSYLAVPIETSGGDGAITLCALSAETGVYNRGHLELLAVAGRMLAYEWETVKWRADLRRMDEQLRDPERTDALTGLLNRAAFAEALEHEWQSAAHGPSESYLVLCRFPNLDALGGRLGAPVLELLLKDAAEVMQQVIRRSDHAGRLAEDVYGALLVGCKGRDGAEAFLERFEEALVRAARERPASLELRSAVQPLAGAESPQAALAAAEATALAGDVAVPGEAA